MCGNHTFCAKKRKSPCLISFVLRCERIFKCEINSEKTAECWLSRGGIRWKVYSLGALFTSAKCKICSDARCGKTIFVPFQRVGEWKGVTAFRKKHKLQDAEKYRISSGLKSKNVVRRMSFCSMELLKVVHFLLSAIKIWLHWKVIEKGRIN